jgi:tRNA threonylcarbamoyladenosine biosynthesis protein TsaB
MTTYLLAIETSTEICSVALGKNSDCIALVESERGNSHTEKIILFIDEVLQQSGLQKTQLDAVCISEGPGSYTGLRIGLSSAKGFCDALEIPLIAISTLQSMAWGVRQQYTDYKYYCPMIDARRMEVYAAVYNQHLQLIEDVNNVILDENTYANILSKDKVVFSGNGTGKAQSVLSGNRNAVFCNVKTSARYVLALGYENFFNRSL